MLIQNICYIETYTDMLIQYIHWWKVILFMLLYCITWVNKEAEDRNVGQKDILMIWLPLVSYCSIINIRDLSYIMLVILS